ncbi:MAG: outer membrane beta-barrel protein [bacterium]
MSIRALAFGAMTLLATPALAEALPAATSADSGEATQATKKKTVTETTKKKTVTTPPKKTNTARPAQPRNPPPGQAKKTPRRRKKARNETPVVDQMLNKGAMGLTLGVSSSWLECDCTGAAGDVDYDSVIGFYAGGVYDKAFNRFLSYRVGAMYHGKSAAYDVGGRDVEITNHTIEARAALLVRYTLNPFASLYLAPGLFAGFVLATDATIDGKKNNDIGEDFASLDYGLDIGLGAFFALSRSRGLMASAQVTYSHGFANLYDSEQVELPEGDALKTRALMLTGGVHF